MNGDNQQKARFYELLKPELPGLQAFSQKLVGNREQGEDLLQDALYYAWRSFRKLRESQAFKPWLYRILLNRYRTNLRQFKRRLGQIVPLADDIIDDSQIQARAARDRLNIAMGCLSVKDRALVTLHELEGWTYPELAEMFGCREAALRTRLSRCRQKMREALLKYYERIGECSLMTGVIEQYAAAKQERI